jgi:hypothetical protein
MSLLMGVTGRLKTLVDRLTSGRAANLDNLDAAVTTRAAASTALSTASWTSGRAANLDNLDAAVSSRLSTVINSIQTGTITIPSGNNSTVDATITSVNTSKAVVIPGGYYLSGGVSDPNGVNVTLHLAGATTVRATHAIDIGAASVVVRYTVVEFK